MSVRRLTAVFSRLTTVGPAAPTVKPSPSTRAERSVPTLAEIFEEGAAAVILSRRRGVPLATATLATASRDKTDETDETDYTDETESDYMDEASGEESTSDESSSDVKEEADRVTTPETKPQTELSSLDAQSTPLTPLTPSTPSIPSTILTTSTTEVIEAEETEETEETKDTEEAKDIEETEETEETEAAKTALAVRVSYPDGELINRPVTELINRPVTEPHSCLTADELVEGDALTNKSAMESDLAFVDDGTARLQAEPALPLPDFVVTVDTTKPAAVVLPSNGIASPPRAVVELAFVEDAAASAEEDSDVVQTTEMTATITTRTMVATLMATPRAPPTPPTTTNIQKSKPTAAARQPAAASRKYRHPTWTPPTADARYMKYGDSKQYQAGRMFAKERRARVEQQQKVNVNVKKAAQPTRRRPNTASITPTDSSNTSTSTSNNITEKKTPSVASRRALGFEQSSHFQSQREANLKRIQALREASQAAKAARFR